MRTFIVMMLAVVLGRTAYAEVYADGTYAPTGHAGVDVALHVVNAIIKEHKNQEEIAKLYTREAHYDTVLLKRLDALQDKAKEIRALKDKANTEADLLRKGHQQRVMDAHGDKALEAKADEDAAKRELELKRAAEQLDAAAGALDSSARTTQKMLDTLKVMKDMEDHDRLRYWQKGGGKKMTDLNIESLNSLKRFGDLVSKAGGTLQQGSDINAQHEEVGAFVVKVRSFSGKRTELWINGKKLVDASTQKFNVGKDRKVAVRAVLVDARRKQAREIKDTEHIHVTKATDYRLSYEMKAGHKATDWLVSEEGYDWRKPETRTGSHLMDVSFTSSGTPKSDLLSFVFSGDTASETVRTYVNGSIKWKGPREEEDSEGAAIELSIEPAR